MFEALTQRLEAIFDRLRGAGRLTEENIQEALREVRVALLEADVNFKVVRDFVERVREKARRAGGAPEPHARASRSSRSSTTSWSSCSGGAGAPARRWRPGRRPSS